MSAQPSVRSTQGYDHCLAYGHMLPGSCQPHNKGLEATLTFSKDEYAIIVAFLKTLTGQQPQSALPIMPPSTDETPKPRPFN